MALPNNEFEQNRFEKIKTLLKLNKHKEAISKLKIIYKLSKSKKTKARALFFMAKIFEHKKNFSKAFKYYLYVQKMSGPKLNKLLNEKADEELEIDDIFEEIPRFNKMYITSMELELKLIHRLNYRPLVNEKDLEVTKRKILFLLEIESKLTFLDQMLEYIDSKKLEKIRRKTESNFFIGLAQSFFSKSFDLTSSGETIQLNYLGHGPKFLAGYQNESFYKGWMAGISFSSIYGEMAVDSGSSSTIEFFTKDKNFYLFEGSYSYYFRPQGGESKFGMGIDIFYITYDLSLPSQLNGFSEESLAFNFSPHFLYEYESNKINMFSKLGLIIPGTTMQFELGVKYNF